MSKQANKRFYQITTSERTANINIYGDITSWPWKELGEVSANNIKKEIDELDVDTINVFINSYGGEVAEALAIYSALKRHSAKIHTYCDGFACSAATIIFAAGEERTMGSIALLMIHNCMSYVGYANSDKLRKAAEDNDKINQSSIEAYKKISNLSEDEIKALMNNETWLTAAEALQYGFATEIADSESNETAQQSAFQIIRTAVLADKSKSGSSFDDVMKKLDEIQASIQTATQKNEEPKTPEKKGDNKQKVLNFLKNFN